MSMLVNITWTSTIDTLKAEIVQAFSNPTQDNLVNHFVAQYQPIISTVDINYYGTTANQSTVTPFTTPEELTTLFTITTSGQPTTLTSYDGLMTTSNASNAFVIHTTATAMAQTSLASRNDSRLSMNTTFSITTASTVRTPSGQTNQFYKV